MSLLLLLKPHEEEVVVTPTTGGGRNRRYRAAPLPVPQNEDDELITWIQTHRPDPLRRR